MRYRYKRFRLCCHDAFHSLLYSLGVVVGWAVEVGAVVDGAVVDGAVLDELDTDLKPTSTALFELNVPWLDFR